MEPSDDFKELLELLNDHQVEYMIVGGYAMAQHGVPRFTGDLDVYFRVSQANAERLSAVLDAFGFAELGLKPEDFLKPEAVVQLGYPPVRIDFLNTLTGIEWSQADASAVKGSYAGVNTRFISKDQLIQNKRALGRAKDIADIEELTS